MPLCCIVAVIQEKDFIQLPSRKPIFLFTKGFYVWLSARSQWLTIFKSLPWVSQSPRKANPARGLQGASRLAQKPLLGLCAGKITLWWPFSCALACLIRDSWEGSMFYSLFPHTVSMAAIVKLWGEGPWVPVRESCCYAERDVNRRAKKKKRWGGWTRKKKKEGKSHVLPPCALCHLRTASSRLVFDRPLSTLVLPALLLKCCTTRFFPAELPDVLQGAGVGLWGEKGGRCTVYEPASGKRKRGRRIHTVLEAAGRAHAFRGWGSKKMGANQGSWQRELLPEKINRGWGRGAGAPWLQHHHVSA